MGNEQLKQLSKASIQEAFLQLLEERAWDRISIQDIIGKAGVSRMTYYRHFESKEDILIQLYDAFLQTIAEHTPSRLTASNKRLFLTRLFTVIREYKTYIRLLILNDPYLGMIHRTNRFYLKRTSHTAISPLKLLGFIGMLSNICFYWVRHNCEEPIDALVEICLETVNFP
ncbi:MULTISPECIES: TetR/AcrR family transcriptional regulator [Saccharibacillus]|uniref:TetR/AcrR family transcriptional regulator n=1 Tax=Saccharibacillus TaxID=456492 RepID=UPI00123C73CA|nr:TetR/AcrR family transcriptional regulator [Saccharibacillus sp. WB 17]MWJ33819.1 TetR family transcriptional regulator [Saccharibacillus sp. WB 17]